MASDLSKKSTAPKSKPMSNNGKSVHSDLPKREPVWNGRRRAIVLALRKLGAVSHQTAVTASDIQKLACTFKWPVTTEEPKPDLMASELTPDRLDYIKICLDVYRQPELVHNGFVKTTTHEGERQLRYYLTAKGQKTVFPEVNLRRGPKSADEKASSAKVSKNTQPAGAKF